MDEVEVTGLADAVIARAVKQRDLLAALDEHCRSVSARVTSRDGTVSVEVDGLGTMTGLWLNARALALDPDELARVIVEIAAAAGRTAAERQHFLVGEFNTRMRALHEAPLTRWDGSPVDPR